MYSYHERIQIVDYIAIGLTSITVLLYLRLLYHQHGFVSKNTLTLRLVVLNVRTALLVPGFSICYLFALMYPRSYLYMQLPEAFIQAYSVFCFFALFVLYCGGPDKCISIFKTSSRTWPDCLFKTSLNANPRVFYQYVFWSLLQFITIRPIIVAIQIITGYLDMLLVTEVISVITSLMVAWAIIALLKTYHVLFEHCHGLNAMTKVTVIKGTIGIVLGEGFIEQLVFACGLIQPNKETLSIRLYCFAVIVELVLIAVLLERVFSTEIKVEKALNPDFQPHIIINESTDGVNVISFCKFIRMVLSVTDVFEPVVLLRPASIAPQSKELMLSETRSTDFGPRPPSQKFPDGKLLGGEMLATPTLTGIVTENHFHNRSSVNPRGSAVTISSLHAPSPLDTTGGEFL